MSIKRITFAILSIALFSISLTSCSPNSIADEDSLYDTVQGVEKDKVKIMPNG